MNALENLCNAVIHRAVEDWRLAAKRIKSSRKPSPYDIFIKIECEEFLMSDRFNIFTQLDGKVLLYKLKEECEI